VGLAKDLVALYPEEPYPHVLLSRVELIRGNVGEATALCNNALLLDRRYAPAIVSRAHAYIAQGDAEAARVSFEKLLMFDDQILASVGREGIAYADFLYGRFDAASESMDEAIRLAMSDGSTRRGMLYAFRWVDYLCELGRVDAAEAVLDRWVSRQTEIPTELGALRILISRGNLPEVRGMRGQIERDERWQSWMRSLSMDYADFEALAFIQRNDYQKALEVLDASTRDAGGTRRAYLKGYALFQNGEAEQAAGFLQQTRSRLYSVVFPYHSDPVLFVQSVFFLGEVALARGESEQAQIHYRDFLEYWGDADWELQAVDRARTRLETLSSKSD
jgi:tetratricopeptide (TPR) repeat protein